MYGRRSVALVLAILGCIGMARAHPPWTDSAVIAYDFSEAGWYTESVSGTAAITGAYGYHSAPVALAIEGDNTGLLAGFGQRDATLGNGLPPTIPGETYTIWAWVNADAASEDTPALFDVASWLATVTQLQLLKSQVPGSGWQRVMVGSYVNRRIDGQPFDPVHDGIGTVVLTFQISTFNGSGFGSLAKGRWLFDDVEIVSVEEEAMTKRREIREAITSRIAAVTIANGYAVNVGQVETGPVRIETITSFPHVSVKHGEEEKKVGAFQTKDSTITYYVGVVCKRTDSAGADSQCDDFCGEIEKALELFSGGQFLGLGYVTNVFVNGIDPAELTPEVARDLAAWSMSVAVTYTHARRQP
jgi:hypothetical protein